MSSRLITLRAMERFRCIGSDCEEDCCHGWAVFVKKEAFSRIREAMGSAGKNRFKSSLTWDKEKNIGIMKLRANGDCSFLDARRLCHLQGRYGAEILPTACTMFPRSVAKNGSCHELTGSIACPEFARLLLQNDDGADLVENSTDLLPVPTLPLAATTPDNPTPYQAKLDPVRELVLSLLTLRDIPVRSRLFILARFADRTAPFFSNTKSNCDEAKLRSEIEGLHNPPLLRELADNFAALKPRSDWALGMIQTLLVIRTRLGEPALGTLIRRIWATNEEAHGSSAEVAVQRAEGGYNPATLLATYGAMAHRLESKYSARVDLYFENFSRHYFFTHWFTDSENLLLHTLKLLVPICVIRFLFYSHPDLVRHFEINGGAGLASTEEETLVNRCAIEAFLTYGRTIHHTPDFLQRLRQSLAEQEMNSFPHAVSLIQF